MNGAGPVIRDFLRTGYVAAVFKTPKPGDPNWKADRNGSFLNASFGGGPNVTMSISRKCGDFNADPSNIGTGPGQYMPTKGCLRTNVPVGDANLVLWKFTSNAPGSYCNLQPDTTYYVNIMFTDPTSRTQCPNPTKCVVATLYNHN